MAFDPAIHDQHPETGLHIDKRTGLPAGLAPLPIVRVNHDDEYPKWVVPHSDHIGRHPQNDYVVTPLFTQHHLNRVNGEVTVLVHNEDEELRAMTGPAAESEEPSRSEGASDERNELEDNTSDGAMNHGR